MDNYEQPMRRQLRPTETEDVAVQVRCHPSHHRPHQHWFSGTSRS